MDSIFVERLWRSLKYEELYLNANATMAEAKAALAPGSISTTTNARTRTSAIARGDKFTNCGDAHDRRCQPAALPASRASSESGEMLAFAHIPTGTVANKGFDID